MTVSRNTRIWLMYASPAFCLFVAAAALGGCASTPTPSHAEQSSTVQGHQTGRIAYLVTRRNGKNVVEVLRGNPDKASLAVAREFIDDNIHLKEGEKTVVELVQYRPN